uniref:cyclin-L1a isoform X2 n=1 Tax=Epinephelus lanceolatus TaxID=310571 RepID=UPI00144885E7|nr:cyclin-L1a isoform X2 [Epinephelus lanceolatus]
MAAGPLSVSSNASTNNDGILIGDKVYSEVYLTIDNSLIPEERLSPTPSMLDGLDLNTETDLRILGCELIQSAGILLRLPQVAMATGQVLFHRFFYSKSFVKHSFEIVAMACINLASKIEEAPRRIRDVINVFHHLRQIRGKKTPSSLILDQNYINTKNQVIKAERRVLKELGFCVHVKHPHKVIVMYLQVLECEKNQTLVQTAWNYMNDTLRTNVFVRFQAETIACACIFLAARALQIPLPSRPNWYLLFGASEEDVKEVCITTLRLYTRKKPNYDHLEREVERRKTFLAEAKLKAKGLNPDGTPALSTLGGFSPASKPCSPNVVKVEEKSPNPQTIKPVKKEPDSRTQVNKSPHNGQFFFQFEKRGEDWEEQQERKSISFKNTFQVQISLPSQTLQQQTQSLRDLQFSLTFSLTQSQSITSATPALTPPPPPQVQDQPPWQQRLQAQRAPQQQRKRIWPQEEALTLSVPVPHSSQSRQGPGQREGA